MGWIDSYVDAESREEIRTISSSVATLLTVGPLILGECHASPNAKAIIGDLIQAGRIKHLFLEIPTDCVFALEPLNKLLQLKSKSEVEKALVANENDEIGMLQYLDDIETFKQNKIRTSLLVRKAFKYGCKVYFGDCTPKGGPSATLSKDGLEERNKSVVEVLAGAKLNPQDGILILAGGAHLTDTKCSNANTIQKLASIPSDRVIMVPPHSLTKDQITAIQKQGLGKSGYTPKTKG